MANPQHIEWLLEGVEAWNARRERDDFVPDFEGVDFDDVMERELFERTLVPRNGKLDRQISPMLDFRSFNFSRANLQSAVIFDAIFDNVDFCDADLKNINLQGSTLRGTNLKGADLYEGVLAHCQLLSVSFLGCDAEQVIFDSSRISRSNFERTNLSHASFQNVIFRNSEFSGANLYQAEFAEANVRSNLDSDRPIKIGFTNFSDAKNITQDQLDSMLGDSETRIPEHLTRPAHWPKAEFPEEPEETDPAPETETASTNPEPSPQHIPRATIAARLETEAPVIALTSASLLEQIANYREQIRGDNILAAEHTEFRDGLLDFLDTLHVDLKSLLTTLPAPGNAPTPIEVEETATWTERFIGSAIPELGVYTSPEALAKTAIPTGIILGCGALAAAITGTVTLSATTALAGFGAGSFFGQWLTRTVKANAPADKLTKQMKPDTPEPDTAE